MERRREGKKERKKERKKGEITYVYYSISKHVMTGGTHAVNTNKKSSSILGTRTNREDTVSVECTSLDSARDS